MRRGSEARNNNFLTLMLDIEITITKLLSGKIYAHLIFRGEIFSVQVRSSVQHLVLSQLINYYEIDFWSGVILQRLKIDICRVCEVFNLFSHTIYPFIRCFTLFCIAIFCTYIDSTKPFFNVRSKDSL